ncbi:hypothetical protein H5410_046352 [Solanum commersonii]|uniref:Uncharacterized protein n=1 Tax=Solanum commersonii TaxID=4109 RepID=A0A9J5XFF6_SOLCO|nr:hypothetical protein H5410_046352 [Solanum commersonii]
MWTQLSTEKCCHELHSQFFHNEKVLPFNITDQSSLLVYLGGVVRPILRVYVVENPIEGDPKQEKDQHDMFNDEFDVVDMNNHDDEIGKDEVPDLESNNPSTSIISSKNPASSQSSRVNNVRDDEIDRYVPPHERRKSKNKGDGQTKAMLTLLLRKTNTQDRVLEELKENVLLLNQMSTSYNMFIQLLGSQMDKVLNEHYKDPKKGLPSEIEATTLVELKHGRASCHDVN